MNRGNRTPSCLPTQDDGGDEAEVCALCCPFRTTALCAKCQVPYGEQATPAHLGLDQRKKFIVHSVLTVVGTKLFTRKRSHRFGCLLCALSGRVWV